MKKEVKERILIIIGCIFCVLAIFIIGKVIGGLQTLKSFERLNGQCRVITITFGGKVTCTELCK